MIIRKKDNRFIVKLIKNEILDFDVFNQQKIKELFKKIILTLKKKYNIGGILKVDTFLNEYYGMIIEMETLYNDTNEIDMKISFHLDTIFLYELNDEEIKSEKNIYYYKNKYYGIYQKPIDSNIIYKTDTILEKGIKVL